MPQKTSDKHEFVQFNPLTIQMEPLNQMKCSESKSYISLKNQLCSKSYSVINARKMISLMKFNTNHKIHLSIVGFDLR